jgi:HAD superfamily hydrolase (TIGR01509 family)
MNDSLQITDILFDLGNVLVRFDWDIALSRLEPRLSSDMASLLKEDKQAFKKLFYEPGNALESGEIDFEKFHRIMSARLAISIEEKEFCRIWCDIFELDEDMASLGEELSKDYGTWLVSNTSEAHYQWIINKFPRVLFYRDAALSFDLRVMKPSDKYYSLLIEKFGIDPARSVFIDDIQENVDGAVRAGMKGIVFRGRDRLVAELATMGVKAQLTRESKHCLVKAM